MTTTLQVRSWQTEDETTYKAVESWTCTPNTDGTTTVELRDPRLFRRSVPIVLRRSGCTVIATLVEADTCGLGDSQIEAVENLKRILLAPYRLLPSWPRDEVDRKFNRDPEVMKQYLI